MCSTNNQVVPYTQCLCCLKSSFLPSFFFSPTCSYAATLISYILVTSFWGFFYLLSDPVFPHNGSEITN